MVGIPRELKLAMAHVDELTDVLYADGVPDGDPRKVPEEHRSTRYKLGYACAMLNQIGHLLDAAEASIRAQGKAEKHAAQGG